VDDVSIPVTTMTPDSDGQMTSLCILLLGTTVATDGFCSLILCYHCSDEQDARDYSGL
jgi:hypothetical protein